MKNLTKVGLGVLTSMGGFLEVGSMGTGLQAGAAFGFRLLWALAMGTICIAFLTEMSGRLAAVSHHTVSAAVRKRFGIAVHAWPLAAQVVVDLLVLGAEIGGAALALSMATGTPLQVWAIPVAVLTWALLWYATFSSIEHGMAVLGLVTLSFAVAAVRLAPGWRDVAANLVPHRPPQHTAHYAYLAVSILGATISPYMVTFYSSGAIEEKWSAKDLLPNRIVAGLGMGFGCLVGMAVVVVAALVLAPRGIQVEKYQDAAGVLTPALGRWGFPLFCASLEVGCLGAAFELALDVSYIVAQTFGWEWGENKRPAEGARFALVYTGAIALATIPALVGIDPLSFTMFSMVVTVLALPILVAPLIVVMNDQKYLRNHTNGVIANTAVTVVVLVAVTLAILAVPVQVAGG